MHRHLLERQPEALRNVLARRLRRLRRRPHFAMAIDDARRRTRRLHRGVREVRQVILGFHLARSLRHGCIDVACLAKHFPGLARGLLELGAIGGRVVASVLAIVPVDLQRLPPLHRDPGIVRHDRDAAERLKLRGRRRARNLDHFHDTGNRQRLRRIEARHFAAEHRRARDDGIEHSIESHVDAVLGATVRDVRSIEQGNVLLADVTELRRILQPQRVARRHRKLALPLARARQSRACDRSRREPLRDSPRARSSPVRSRSPQQPSPASCVRQRRIAAWDRRSDACCAIRPCPDCRTSLRPPAPASRAPCSSRLRAHRQ